MGLLDIVKLCSKTGIDILIVGAGCWVVYFLIKHTVIRLGAVIDKLADKVEKISNQIDKHDMQADTRGQFLKKEHEALIRQHDEMITTLGRINGYKD